jgi:hypothetical protein
MNYFDSKFESQNFNYDSKSEFLLFDDTKILGIPHQFFL